MISIGRFIAIGVVAASLATAAPAQSADAIRIASPYSTTTLDPMRSGAAGNIETYGLLYARLIRRNAETGELEPGLAESWEVSPEGTSYTFRLRDATFSNGTPITAEDVAFSLERVRSDERSAYPAPLGTVESISAADSKTVEIKLKNAFAPFLGNLEIWNMGIVSKADVDARGEDTAFAEAPATSGPYQVKEWKPNEKLVLEPNPNYWREGFPKSDAMVELVEVASADTRIAMLKAGEIDAVREVPWSQIDTLKADGSVDMRLEPSTVIHVILLNSKREPFSNTQARQAAGHALDREALVKAVTQGHSTLANTTLPGALDFHDKSNPGIPYDANKAKELLEKSGMAGREITILMTPSAANEQMSLFMQAQWQAIGLKAKIEKVDGGAWWSALAEGEYDAAPTWWFNETPDPDLAVRWSVCGTCGSESFYTFYTNPKVDELVEAGSREADPDKRAEAYKEIQRITTDEVPQIPLFYAPYANAYSKRMKGLNFTSSLQWTLEDATIGE